jgi:excisionase family DNA binding protein
VPQAFQAQNDGLELTVTAKAIIASRLPVRRGFDENEAAVYLSLSPSLFRKLVADGRMPRPRLADGRRIYDIEELDMAFKALPREGGDVKPIFVSKDQDSWADYQ